MNYNESKQILEEIKKAEKILLVCHRGPDPDSIGSNLAMKIVLEEMGKSVDVICSTGNISKQTEFLTGFDSINLGVDFNSFDFSKYNLLISIDSPNVKLLTGKDNAAKQPDIKSIIIDHHYISTLQGIIRLVDEDATSLGEMLYLIFEDWKIHLNKDIAECLFTSIVGDTGAFAYPNVTAETLKISSDLMKLGVDKNMIVTRIYRSEEFEMLKFWAEVLKLMEKDEDGKFVWAMVPYEVYKNYARLDDSKAKSASLFAPIVEGTDFGFIGVEEAPRVYSISFRGRTTFDTSAIAKALGGGGHKASSAVKFEGPSFEEAVIKVLETARKYAKKD